MKPLHFAVPLAFALVGCSSLELRDRTVLSGTVTIPPAIAEEKDPVSSPNDATPQPLGEDGASSLTYRSVVLSGSTSSWTPDTGGPGTEDDEVYGDADLYAFTPVADGTFTVTFSFNAGAGGDTGGDGVVYDVYIIDAGSLDVLGGLGSASTDGSAGTYTVSADVLGGSDYVLVIGGLSNADGEVPVDYSAVLSGSAPGENIVLVGAYTEGDPAVASPPVGGSTVTGWVYDEATYTWSGSYELLYMRSVELVDEDTADTAPATVTVDEALDGPLYLLAGTLTNLNGTPSAGSLYSTTSVEAAVTNEATEVAEAIVLDGLFPKVIGIQATETLPDVTVAQLDAVGYLDETTVVAQDLGMLSGLGYVDTIDGSSTLTGLEGTDQNDIDVYSFTVPEAMNVRMVASWPNVVTDIDFGIWGNDPAYGTFDWFSWGDTYCQTAADPEACETVVAFEPGLTYYVLAMGYLGDPGEEPYHIELEWVP